MQRFFSTLHQNRHLYPDLDLQVGKTRISAHRIILASVSSYFRTLFQRNIWSNDRDSVIYVDEQFCSENILTLLVDYSYSHSIKIDSENVCDLIVVADYYGFESVIEQCNDFIEKHLTTNTCISIWEFSNDFNLAKIEATSFDYILRYFTSISSSRSFLSLSDDRFNRIITNEWLNCDDNEINEATDKWQKQRNITEPGEETMNAKVGLVECSPTTHLKTKSTKNTPKINLNLLKQRITRRLSCAGDFQVDQNQVHNTQRYPRDVLFAIGGWHDSSPSNHIETYDMRSRKWNVVTQLPDFASEAPRAYHAVVYCDSFLYFIGGYDGNNYYDKVRRYHVDPRVWSNCSRMYKRRCYVSAAYLDGGIYACGGLDGHLRLKCAERYDIETNSWTQLPDMLQSRSDASCSAYNDKIFMCGGFSGQACLLSVETFTPEDHVWTEVISMISPRSGVVTLVHYGKLWALGGFNGNERLNTTEYYDGIVWRPGPRMNRERSNFAGSALNGNIIVCGGYNDTGTMKCVESLSFDSDRHHQGWSEEQSMNISRSALTSIVLSDLSKDRLITLLPRSRRPKRDQLTFPTLRRLVQQERENRLRRENLFPIE
jgi:kelch-like protein 10